MGDTMTEQQLKQEHDLNQATIAKLIAETAKINSENKFYPLLQVGLACLAIGGVVGAALIKTI